MAFATRVSFSESLKYSASELANPGAVAGLPRKPEDEGAEGVERLQEGGLAERLPRCGVRRLGQLSPEGDRLLDMELAEIAIAIGRGIVAAYGHLLKTRVK